MLNPLSFDSWPYPSSSRRRELLLRSNTGLIAHILDSTISVYSIECEGLPNQLVWTISSMNISAAAFYDGSNIPKPAKSWLVVCTTGGTILVLDLVNRKRLCEYRFKIQIGTAAAWSPTSRKDFFVGTSEGFLCRFRIGEDGLKIINRIELECTVNLLCVSSFPEGNLVIASKEEKTVIFVKQTLAKVICTIKIANVLEKDEVVCSLDFYPGTESYAILVTSRKSYIVSSISGTMTSFLAIDGMRDLRPTGLGENTYLAILKESMMLIGKEGEGWSKYKEMGFTAASKTTIGVPILHNIRYNEIVVITQQRWMLLLEIRGNKFWVKKMTKLIPSQPLDWSVHNGGIAMTFGDGQVMLTKGFKFHNKTIMYSDVPVIKKSVSLNDIYSIYDRPAQKNKPAFFGLLRKSKAKPAIELIQRMDTNASSRHRKSNIPEYLTKDIIKSDFETGPTTDDKNMVRSVSYIDRVQKDNTPYSNSCDFVYNVIIPGASFDRVLFTANGDIIAWSAFQICIISPQFHTYYFVLERILSAIKLPVTIVMTSPENNNVCILVGEQLAVFLRIDVKPEVLGTFDFPKPVVGCFGCFHSTLVFLDTDWKAYYLTLDNENAIISSTGEFKVNKLGHPMSILWTRSGLYVGTSHGHVVHLHPTSLEVTVVSSNKGKVVHLFNCDERIVGVTERGMVQGIKGRFKRIRPVVGGFFLGRPKEHNCIRIYSLGSGFVQRNSKILERSMSQIGLSIRKMRHFNIQSITQHLSELNLAFIMDVLMTIKYPSVRLVQVALLASILQNSNETRDEANQIGFLLTSSQNEAIEELISKHQYEKAAISLLGSAHPNASKKLIEAGALTQGLCSLASSSQIDTLLELLKSYVPPQLHPAIALIKVSSLPPVHD